MEEHEEGKQPRTFSEWLGKPVPEWVDRLGEVTEDSWFCVELEEMPAGPITVANISFPKNFRWF